jgi:hypothetical protein
MLAFGIGHPAAAMGCRPSSLPVRAFPGRPQRTGSQLGARQFIQSLVISVLVLVNLVGPGNKKARRWWTRRKAK